MDNDLWIRHSGWTNKIWLKTGEIPFNMQITKNSPGLA